MSQASYQKRMREKARQEKAALKRERKQQRAADAAAASDEPQEAEPEVPQDRVLRQLEDLHKKFDDEQITFDEFEERKAELIAQLSI